MSDNSLARVEINEDAILKHLGLDARDPAAQALVLTCRRYGLDPVLKHAVLIQGRLYVTRDGLLHVAHRSGQLDGLEVLEQGETPSHYVAKVAVYRKDMSRRFAYVGRYPKKGHNREYGPEMAVKCAEVMALRRAFDVSLAAREEMWDSEVDGLQERHAPSAAAGSDSGASPAQRSAGEASDEAAVQGQLDRGEVVEQAGDPRAAPAEASPGGIDVDTLVENFGSARVLKAARGVVMERRSQGHSEDAVPMKAPDLADLSDEVLAQVAVELEPV